MKDITVNLKTDTSDFGELISEIKKGEIKIPQFQRKFVWKDEQALRLLDSISKRYPIASILLWKTKDKLHAERNIGNFCLPETDDLTPTNYVLDGQQRLTVIYSCLGADEQDEGFKAGYDLVNECFVECKPDSDPLTIFPLRKLYKTTSLLNYRTSLLSQANKDQLQERLDNLITAITQYKLPVVTLKDLTIEEVCPIFERINSSGTRLSTYDLMVAATWTEDFDLNDSVTRILSSLEDKGYETTDRSTILKTLSAISLGSIKETSLTSLRDYPASKIEPLIEQTERALERAVDALSTEFGVHSWDFLSYEAILIIAARIFRDAKSLTADQAVRLRHWFWGASFAERYKVGGENFVSKDMGLVVDFVLHGADLRFGEVISPSEWGTIQFRSNVSRSRAFILLLAARRPRNLANGLEIDRINALSGYNKKEYHHFYPKAYLKSIGKAGKANALGNFVMLNSISNKLISDQPPSEYVPRLIKDLGMDCDAVFASNLLPVPSEFDYAKASFEEFLAARGIILTQYLSELMK